jgi:CheY-like chemotaxis protein
VVASKVLDPHPDLLNLRVLVIDDNATSREILQTMLKDMSFHVTPAASGAEGIEELENASDESPFDLVVVDWKMPEMDGFATIREIRSADPPVSSVKIIMVTAYGREEIIQRAAEADLDGFLIKPVNQSMLFDTIMAAFGKEGSPPETSGFVKSMENAMLTGIRGARILLVEDNEINRQIGEEILRHAGFVVSLAIHGEEAVAMARIERYDLILMDIQMPVMDGFAATKEIRKLPGESGKIPIVAMTAHTMTGDREKSLAAGMNDHIGKPIDPERLFTTLLKWIKPREEALPEGNLSSPSAVAPENLPSLRELPGIAGKTGLARLGGNQELYQHLLVKFRRDFGAAHEELSRLLSQGELDGARRLAHTLQGVAGNIGANSVRSVAEALEEALENGEGPSLGPLLKDLAQELQVVLEGLQDLQAEERDLVPEVLPPGDVAFLREKLLQMRLPLEEHKPKQTKEVLAEVNAYSWPEEYASELVSLGDFLGGYKFADAGRVLEGLVRKLDRQGG